MNKTFPSELLPGTRIKLQKYELDLAPVLFAAVNADRARLRTYLPWVDLIQKESDEENYVRRTAVDWMEGRAFDYGIFARESGAYLGNIGAHTISWEDDRCEIGYWITSAGEGKGFVSEAVQLLEAELFRIGFHRIEIRCNVLNERSASVPKRCGYHLDGVLREDVMEHGHRRNTMVWGKVRA